MVKANATFSLGAGFRAGTSIRWESGVPYSVLATNLRSVTMPPFYHYGFVPATRERVVLPLSRSVMSQLSVEVVIALNDGMLELASRTDGLNVGTRRFGREWQLGLRLTF